MVSQLELNKQEAVMLVARKAISIGVIGQPDMAVEALQVQADIMAATEGSEIIAAMAGWKETVRLLAVLDKAF